jgi:hypothetical protein
MFNQTDEADCKAKKIKQLTIDDESDRASPTHLSFLFAVVELTAKMSGSRQPQQLNQALSTVRSIVLCTPSMGVNLWGESPLEENQRPNARNFGAERRPLLA